MVFTPEVLILNLPVIHTLSSFSLSPESWVEELENCYYLMIKIHFGAWHVDKEILQIIVCWHSHTIGSKVLAFEF